MSKQLEYNQQQVQKYMKLLSTTGGGVMLPDKGAKIRRELQFVKDRSSILKEKLEKAKENGKNLRISIDNLCFGNSNCLEFLKLESLRFHVNFCQIKANSLNQNFFQRFSIVHLSAYS